jgi:hypothetical protein
MMPKPLVGCIPNPIGILDPCQVWKYMKPDNNNSIKGLPFGQFSDLVNPLWLDTPIRNKTTLPGT